MFAKPRKASTVAILKNIHDDEKSFQVLLLKRHAKDRFLPSYYVFPGGAIDDQDSHDNSPDDCSFNQNCSRKEDREFDITLYAMGAIRETFEESGFLLARDRKGKFVSIINDDDIRKYSKYRSMVYENRLSFREMLKREKLEPAFDAIHYISRWITPVFSPIRYDTRFFAALAPEDQYIIHDGIELVETRWMTPAEALAGYKSKEIKMVTPTISTLKFFSSFKTGEEVVNHLALNGGID